MTTTDTTPQPDINAWNKTHRPGTLVRYRGRTAVTWTAAYPLNNGAMVRLNDGTFAHIADLTIHPQAAALAVLPRADVPTLEFPPPPCAFCETVDTEFDGRGFCCPECGARWSSNGFDGTRLCVECDDDADIVGPDGQPRCLPCQAGLNEHAEAGTEPYQCRRCETEVVGMPSSRQAAMRGLCGGCCNADRRNAWLAEVAAR